MREVQLERKKIVLDAPTREFLSLLKSLRQEHDYSCKELVRRLGMGSISSLSYYERGLRLPSLGCLIKMAETLKYDLSDSVNYKFFYGEIDLVHLRAEIEGYGLTLRELSRRINFEYRQPGDTLRGTHYASVSCLWEILSYLNANRKSLRSEELSVFNSSNWRKLRKQRGLTQRELSKRSGVSVRTIYRLEAGVVKPKSNTVSKLWNGLYCKSKAMLFRCKFDCGALYQIFAKCDAKSEKLYTFEYVGKTGEHHVFREVGRGWTRSYTDAQLVGKEVRMVKS